MQSDREPKCCILGTFICDISVANSVTVSNTVNTSILFDSLRLSQVFRDRVRYIKDNVVLRCLNTFKLMYTAEDGKVSFDLLEVQVGEDKEEPSAKVCRVMNELVRRGNALKEMTTERLIEL